MPSLGRLRSLGALRRHAVTRWVLVVVLAFAGAYAGALVGGRVTHEVGPFEMRGSVVPALTGDTVIDVPPLGSLLLDTHDGPLRLELQVEQLRAADVQRIVADPARLTGLEGRLATDTRSMLTVLLIRAAIGAVVGAVAVPLVVLRLRSWRPIAASGLVGVLGLVAIGSTVATSFNARSLAQPKFSGLLASAPAAVGDVQDIVTHFSHYREELARLVTNVSRLYAVTSTLPSYEPSPSTIRVLHVSDIHLAPQAFDVMRSVIKQFHIDAIVDSGDLTDHGTEAEARLADQIATLGVPYVFIRGNHDSTAVQDAVAAQPNATVLVAGKPATVAGLRFYGEGDPRFTPDKLTKDDSMSKQTLQKYGEIMRRDLQQTEPPNVDVAVAHDPVEARELDGAAPLILAGHIHHRERANLPRGSLLLVEGSTGGAGLRALEGSTPTPVELSVLYFDRGTHRLQAWDDITIGGLGLSSAQISRHLVEPGEAGTPKPSPGSPSPLGSSASGSSASGPSASGPGGGQPLAYALEPAGAFGSDHARAQRPHRLAA